MAINCYINLISAWKNIITVFILISLLSRLRTAEKDLDDGIQGSYSPGEGRSNGAVLGMLKVMDPKTRADNIGRCALKPKTLKADTSSEAHKYNQIHSLENF